MLELKNITKIFPGVKALDNVSLTFRSGEIHALLGENGAGKSTLIKIICGIHKADTGELKFFGEELCCDSYHDALEKGICIVNQEIQVIPESSVAENILLHRMKDFRKRGFIDWTMINAEAARFIEMVKLEEEPETLVAELSAAKKQLIQIAKALASDSRMILLDEPTSSLTEHEAENLFKLLSELKKKDVIIVFVSHKLEEVFRLCDLMSVLRDGCHVGTEYAENLTTKALIKMMIGRETQDIHLGCLDTDEGEIVLETVNLHCDGKIHNADLKLRKGEILGLYGLVGSGRTELAKLIIGEDKADFGEVFINGKKAQIKSTADSLYKYNLGYVTENRKEEGLILDAEVRTNITITIWKRFIGKFLRFINLKQEDNAAGKMVDAMNIKITSLAQKTDDLSGGNQQKISIAKWLAADCDILIIDEPTVGVDIGAKEAIHQLIWDLAKDEGKSIILISSDMPEMIKLARRIYVFREKQIVGEISCLDEREYSYSEVSHMIGEYLA